MQDQNKQAKKSINDKEFEILKYWQENNIFEKSIKSPAGREEKDTESFSFYDGPPFATGMPHHGHILAGTIKDAIPRYQTMKGKRVRRVWGWDCHGLPIENMIEKEFNLNSKKEIEEYGIDKFNTAAANSVLKYEKEWKRIVPRLGRWVDMEKAYKTMDANYTESVWWVWKSLYDKGLAYEGYKIMHICPRCETPLAQSEVGLEYHDITDMTVTAEFELLNKKYKDNPLYVLAWTTTPWTLPGNTALAVNRNIKYSIVESIFKDTENSNDSTNYFIVATNRINEIFSKSESFKIVEEIKIEEYIGEKYKPVFDVFNKEEYLNGLENSENIWKIWHADFITDDAGTGIAHEAPAFGNEDMELAKLNNIPVIKHVKMNGSFVEEVEKELPSLSGLVVKKKDDSISTDIEIIKLLAHSNKLFEKHKIVHSYPLCWRCKTPLLNYATSSWFVDVPKIKDKIISENKGVKWVPEHIRDGRFGKWLEGAREWAVSRRRYWGAPLPIWRSIDGVETKVVGSLEEIATKAKNNYFVMRHGESISNSKRLLDSSGDPNNHLTPAGIEQVRTAADIARNEGIDLIVVSPIARAKESADIIADLLGGTEVVVDERLREFDLGVYDKKTVDEFHERGTRSLGSLDERVDGGETHREVMKRVTSAWSDIENKYENRNVLFITHGAPGWMLAASVSLMTDEMINDEMAKDKSDYWLPNAKLVRLEVKRVPRDETGAINLHKPYIDKLIIKDSRGVDMKIIGDVFDCWFESGSMPYAQLHYPFENKKVFEDNFPADFIAEGMDQTRGWFYSLINLGVGLFDKAPFRNVIVNGVVMAGDGRKMSKSEKNYTDPMELVEKYGADSLRFALANSPVMQGENVLFSDELVEESYKKVVSKLENVLDFYYLYNTESNDETDSEYKLSSLKTDNVLDAWIALRAQQLINSSVDGYENYKLDKAVSEVTSFVDDLSTWYLRRSRERLKASDSEASTSDLENKKQALVTLKYVFVNFAKCIAPMMPFLAERVYRGILEEEIKSLSLAESVHLAKYPSKVDLHEDDINLLKEMKLVRDICSEGLMSRQKNNTPVRQPLSEVILSPAVNISEKYFDIIREELNVKNINFNKDFIVLESSGELIKLNFDITPELKREGEQRELSRVIKDMRKDLGLVATDSIRVTITEDKAYLLDTDYRKDMKIVDAEIGQSITIVKV